MMKDPRTRFRPIVIACSLLAALTLAACGGSDDGASNGGTTPPASPTNEPTGITVTATEWAFDPSTLTVGESFSITLINGGTIEHDFTVDGSDQQVAAIPATQQASASFTLEEGTYTFYCSVPGHRQAGMEGTLTVGS